MKVTRSMVHADLQPFFNRVSRFETVIKQRLLTTLANKLLKGLLAGKDRPGLRCDEVHIPSSDGRWQIRARVYKPLQQEDTLPLLLYFHGGGYILGNPEMSAELIERFINTRPCIVVAPDYRKAYTEPYPAGFNDCYETTLWANDNAVQLGARADAVMVAGHSAGGGLAAAVTLKARDTGDVNIAFQMPIYPMIDDEQPQDAERNIDVPVWNTLTNRIGWQAYLAALEQSGSAIPTYAAAARNSDYAELPPTITFVGTLEPFYRETQAYVRSLRDAGIEVRYAEFEDCFHAFDVIAQGTEIGAVALNFTFDSYAEFYDRFLNQQDRSIET